MTFQTWIQHQTLAKNKALKILIKRPKGQSQPLSEEEISEMFKLLQTAPDVLDIMMQWQEDNALTQKDQSILLKAEKAYYKALLLPNHASSFVYRSLMYWLRCGIISLTTTLLMLGGWSLLKNWNEIHMPLWGVLILGWMVLEIIKRQSTQVLHARCSDIAEQKYRAELTVLAQQGWPFAQMIQGQMTQGFQPTRRQWQQIFQWKQSVLDLTQVTA